MMKEAWTAELAEAGAALEAFAAGPARAAADAMEAAFARAGRAVRGELEALARGGEADLDRLARKIADVLAQAVLQSAAGARAPVNLTMNVAGGPAGQATASANQLAALAAQLIARGGRFT
jgi:hypothetical protein